VKTAILGAGVSGLALARALVEGGFDPADLHLFEATDAVGGLCRSKTVDGFTYDVAGGHILYSKDAQTAAWMKAAGGGEDAFVESVRNTKIRFGDRFVKYPFENGLGDLPAEANFDCVKGYVEAWRERLASGSAAPADFGAWVRWRFGDGIAAHFMDPYNEKVWKRSLDHLTSDWVAGRVPEAPIDDVLRGAVGISTEGYTHQSRFAYPRRGGFGAITDGLAGPLADRVRLSTPVTRLAREGEDWAVDGERFDCVVVTLSLTDLPGLIEGVPVDVGRAMSELEYNSLASLLVALDRPEHTDLSWVYLPHPEQGPANRITYLSNYSPDNAPDGRSSFLCEVTGRGGEALPGAELTGDVLAGLERAGLLEQGEVLFTDRSDVRQAYVVFDHAYAERRRVSLAWLEENDLFPLGRFARFDYDNSDQCVIKARALAPVLLERTRAGGRS
jgi:protoporphyrinogen oxidase